MGLSQKGLSQDVWKAYLRVLMDAISLRAICESALLQNKYVRLVHRGVARDVYPFSIREGYLFCWCSIHDDREVERMNLYNITEAAVSGNEVGYSFPYASDFE